MSNAANTNEVLAKVALREWEAGRMNWSELKSVLSGLGVSDERAAELS